MAKKNIQPEAPSRSIEEMSDVDFIRSVDYLSSPYYRAYMNAQARSIIGEQPAGENTRKQTRSTAAPARRGEKPKMAQYESVSAAVKGAKYSQKRGIFLVLILVLMLALVASVALGAIGSIAALDDFTAIYQEPSAVPEKNLSIGVVDPVIGLLKTFVTLDMNSVFYNGYLVDMDGADTLTTIFLYAVPIAALLLIILVVIGFIKAFSSLFSGRCANGLYKKYRFGLLAILMLVSSAVIFIGGLLVGGLEFSAIGDFFLMKNAGLTVGYTLYGCLGVSVLTFIFSCISYKKQRQ